MLIHLRLYAYHDIDLLALKETNRMSELFRTALFAFINKDSSQFVFNPPADKFYPKQAIYDVRILLRPIEDRELIDFIDTITRGLRTSFYKNLIRMYVFYKFGFVASPYFNHNINNMIVRPDKDTIRENLSEGKISYKKNERSHTNNIQEEIENSSKKKEESVVSPTVKVNKNESSSVLETHDRKIEEDDDEDDDLFLMAAKITAGKK